MKLVKKARTLSITQNQAEITKLSAWFIMKIFFTPTYQDIGLWYLFKFPPLYSF